MRFVDVICSSSTFFLRHLWLGSCLLYQVGIQKTRSSNYKYLQPTDLNGVPASLVRQKLDYVTKAEPRASNQSQLDYFGHGPLTELFSNRSPCTLESGRGYFFIGDLFKKWH